MKKMCSFGLGKGYILVVLVLFAVSGYADLSRSSGLILDARHESVVWFANTDNCVERSVSYGVSLSSVWSGELAFLRIERKVVTPYIEQQEIRTPKKCGNKSGNGSGDFSCFDVAFVNVTKYRTDWLPFDGGAKAVDLSGISSGLEPKTRDVLFTAKSSGKSEAEETVRFCFRTPDKVGQAHISYIALTNSEYASDESTDVNITSQSLIWQLPTLANASYISRNYGEMNLSIETDHLDTFLFNWNGTNYSIYDNSLVLALNFNNNSAIGENSTRFTDISAQGNSGDCSGAACPVWTASGRFGGAYLFDGSDDYVSGASSNFPTGNSPRTVEAWIYTNDWANYRTIICYGSLSYARGFHLVTEVTSGKLIISNYGVLIGQSNDAVPLDTWTYVAVTFDGSVVRYYVNGVNSGNFSGSFNTLLGSLRVGKSLAGWDGADGNYVIEGSIDELRVYNRMLSQDEIWVHYNSEFQKYNSTEYLFYGNITNLISQGTYIYSGWANDTSGNSAGSETRTLTYDSSYPVVQLVTSNNTVWTASSWVNFVYNVSQNLSGIEYCNLTVNDSVLNGSLNIEKNTDQTLYASLVNGAYNWSVNCTGQNGLMNWSTTYNVSVATTTTTTTTTTMAALCSLGLNCNSCTGWVYINATSGTLQALDADSNGKYDRVCCGGIVSNYTVL